MPPPITVPSTAPLVFPRLRGPEAYPAATFALQPSVTIAEEYTDSFNLAAGGKQENFRTIVAPSLTLLINGAFTKGQLGYMLTGAYDTATDDTNLFHSFRGVVTWEATPLLRLTATDTLTQSDEARQADQLGLRRERRTFISNIFGLNSDYLIGTLTTRQYYTLATFFDEGGPDTISHTVGASISHPFLETNTATLGYEYLTSDTSGGLDVSGHLVSASLSRQLSAFLTAGVTGSYELRSVTSGNATDGTDFTIAGASLFAAYGVPGIWSLTASVGYSRLDPEVGADSYSPTSSTTLTYQFARAILTLAGDVGFSETFATGQNSGVVETRGVRGSLSYPFTPFIGGSAVAFYRQNEFTGIAGGAPGRTDDTWGASISFSIELLRWLTLGLEYGYTEATSSVPDGGYTENRAKASLTAVF